jgi:hypothetical protein
MVVSGSSGDIQSSGTYSQSSDYTDHSRSRTSTEGNDWRVAEAEERRAAAARYREIGSRMMSEASYAESHGFQISSDMSNLIQDRYEDAATRASRVAPARSSPTRGSTIATSHGATRPSPISWTT